MTKAEEKARRRIAKQTTKNIIFQFELTDSMNDINIPIVRGWLMDELEKRDPEAFDLWMESDEDSPRKFYK